MMTQDNFIKTIGNAAVANYPKYKILPSLTIAQAILESGWGKSRLSTECFNYFGMKWKSGCGCDYKEYPTKEQRPDGSYYTIMAKFRKYRDPADGIKGYYDFLSGYKRYHNLIGVTDAGKACDLIRQDGWATSLKYSSNLKRVISQHNLTEYDRKAMGMPAPDGSFQVRVRANDLNIRTGPGVDYDKTGKYTGAGIFTIVREMDGWGKLKSGQGWICLKYADRV